MTKNALRLALVVGIVAVVTAYVIITRQPAAPPPPADIGVSGNYSDDWQARCGPLTGPAQRDCTAGLDARYGRVAGAPLPRSGTDARH